MQNSALREATAGISTLRRSALPSAFVIAALACVGSACKAPDGTEGRADTTSLAIVSLSAPDPLLEGSVLRVSPRGVRGPATLILGEGGESIGFASTGSDGADLLFGFTAEAVSTFGVGERVFDVQIDDTTDRSDAWRWPAEVAETVEIPPPTLGARLAGWDETLVVNGDGFVFGTEGLQELVFEGTYLTDEGESFDVDAAFHLSPVEEASRRRAEFVLLPEFGTTDPGEFTGTIHVETRLLNGMNPVSASTPVTLSVRPSAVLDVRPSSFSVGRYVDIVGTGFLDTPGTATLVHLVGEFFGGGGNADIDVSLVPEWRPNSRLRVMVAPRVRGDRVYSEWFGDRAGNFRGEVYVSTSGADNEVYETRPLEVTLTLNPPTQIVVVRLLAGFDASLAHFGLRAARDRIVETALERMRSLYADYRVEFYLEAPDEYAPIVISTLEIGGPDPNGLGLLGYDNSPGKDVGNVRMADSIGGANAETQADGAPGYGGVFIDSFLYWSSDPGLGDEIPDGSPVPDPLFDEVFGPTRESSATLAEVRGEGPEDRVAAVELAVRALGNMIGETAAHEVGHSLGLADPFGPESSFHNAFDGPGCLMDSGAERPFGERAGLEGFAETVFCGESASYLESIHGL